MYSKVIPALTLVVCLPMVIVTARANDCSAVTNATIASAHRAYTATSTTSGGGVPTRVSHSVSTEGKLFEEMSDHWVLSKMTMNDMANQVRAEIGTAKMSCQRVGEGRVGGEATTIYSNHVNNRGNISDNTLWISKATGLPLKTEVKLQNGMQIVTVFDYSHSQAPEKYVEQP